MKSNDDTFEVVRDFLLEPSNEDSGVTYHTLLKKYYGHLLKDQGGVERREIDASRRRPGASKRTARARDVNLNPEPPA
jgi:hypothetical protein